MTGVTVYTTEVNSTKVKISWYLPYSGASRIMFYLCHGQNVEFNDEMNGSKRELTMINLTPGKLYTATVVAYYNRGRRVSGSKNFRTSKYY